MNEVSPEQPCSCEAASSGTEPEPSICAGKMLKLTSLPSDLNNNAESIQELSLDFNILTELPPTLGELVNLTHFSCRGNGLTSINVTLDGLNNLQVLNLSENRLQTIPDSICKLANLKQIIVSSNQLNKLPSAIGDLKQLETLNLSENELSILPESFVQLVALKELDFSFNHISVLPKAFGYLTNLSTIKASHNELKKLSETFYKLPSLKILDLSDNMLSSLGHHTLKSAGKLQKLILDRNLLETIPDWARLCCQLEELSATDNLLSAVALPLAATEDTVPPLWYLNLAGNQISELPESICNLHKLEFLHLGSSAANASDANSVPGGSNHLISLPDNFGHLKSLKFLRLDGNLLSTLPDSFGDLSSLEYLDLSRNQLTVLPDTFVQLGALQFCQMSYNFLENLPDNFDQLKQLESLLLDRNQLETVPDSLMKFGCLRELDLYDNEVATLSTTMLLFMSKLSRLDLEMNKLSWIDIFNRVLCELQAEMANNPEETIVCPDWLVKIQCLVARPGSIPPSISMYSSLSNCASEQATTAAHYSNSIDQQLSEGGTNQASCHIDDCTDPFCWDGEDTVDESYLEEVTRRRPAWELNALARSLFVPSFDHISVSPVWRKKTRRMDLIRLERLASSGAFNDAPEDCT